MKAKKHPKQDINRKSGLFFAIGLLCTMTLTYAALEWKTYAKAYNSNISMNRPDTLLEEEVLKPFTIEQPPKPKIIPPKIKVAEDTDSVEETLIDAIEPDQDTEIAEPEEIVIEEMEEDPVVNFLVIEEVPIFPGCEKAKDKRACFSEKMQKHIQRHFKYPQMEQELGIQGKVNVIFEIGKDGTINNIRYRGPNENLEKEAVRIIQKLPTMIPGKQRGRAVKVPFAIPITFKLQ